MPTNPKIKGKNCVKARKNIRILNFTHQNIDKPTEKTIEYDIFAQNPQLLCWNQ